MCIPALRDKASAKPGSLAAQCRGSASFATSLADREGAAGLIGYVKLMICKSIPIT
jgi:hypothetical protein